MYSSTVKTKCHFEGSQGLTTYWIWLATVFYSENSLFPLVYNSNTSGCHPNEVEPNMECIAAQCLTKTKKIVHLQLITSHSRFINKQYNLVISTFY